MILVACGYMNDHMNGRRTILKRKKYEENINGYNYYSNNKDGNDNNNNHGIILDHDSDNRND